MVTQRKAAPPRPEKFRRSFTIDADLMLALEADAAQKRVAVASLLNRLLADVYDPAEKRGRKIRVSNTPPKRRIT